MPLFNGNFDDGWHFTGLRKADIHKRLLVIIFLLELDKISWIALDKVPDKDLRNSEIKEDIFCKNQLDLADYSYEAIFQYLFIIP